MRSCALLCAVVRCCAQLSAVVRSCALLCAGFSVTVQKYSELQPRIWHAFIILTKVILRIVWAILETDTWELLQKLVELTRNDLARVSSQYRDFLNFIICAFPDF